jgi:hypothetical protein
VSLKRLFIQQTAPEAPKNQKQLERRVSTMPTHDLATWADRSIYTIGYNLTEYAKDPSRLDYLDEAVEGSQALLRLVTEMRTRQG